MLRILMVLVVACLAGTLAGCSEAGGGQEAFYHNNREHAKWVADPSHTPKYANPAAGGPLFY